MNEQSKHPEIDPELEARIVALLLGEASDFEKDELNRLIEERPELAAFKQQMQSVHGLLQDIGAGEAAADDAQWKLPAENRDTVLAAIGGHGHDPPSVQLANKPGASRRQVKGSTLMNLAKIAAVIGIAGFFGSLLMPGINASREAARVSGLLPSDSEATDSVEYSMSMEEAPSTATVEHYYLEDNLHYLEAATIAPSQDAAIAVVEEEIAEELDYKKSSESSLWAIRGALESVPAELGESGRPGEGVAGPGPGSLSVDGVFGSGLGRPDAAAPEGEARFESKSKNGVDDVILDFEGVASGPAKQPFSVSGESEPAVRQGQELAESQSAQIGGFALPFSNGLDTSIAAGEELEGEGIVENRTQREDNFDAAASSGGSRPSISGYAGQTPKLIFGEEEVAAGIELHDQLAQNGQPLPGLPSDSKSEVAANEQWGQRFGDARAPATMPSQPSSAERGGEVEKSNATLDMLFDGDLAESETTHSTRRTVDLPESARKDLGIRGRSAVAAKEKEPESDSDSVPGDDAIVLGESKSQRDEWFKRGQLSTPMTGTARGKPTSGLQNGRANQNEGWVDLGGPEDSSGEVSAPSKYDKIARTDQERFLGTDVQGVQPPRSSTRSRARGEQVGAQRRLGETATFGLNKSRESVLPTLLDSSMSIKTALAKKMAAPAGLNEKSAEKEAFSTFSLHVSDVSFKLARAALARGEWPEAAKIRIEDFVNAFDYGDPMPSENEKVACRLEQCIHPFLQQRNLLRVSMRTAAAGRASNTPLRLTFLLDNSGSMERIDRQQTVRRAFALLAQQLKPIDQVTLISFARQPRLLADRVSGNQSQQLVELIRDLPSEGGTNIEAALQLGFQKAREQQIEGAQNRIILLTDGAVNLGDANPDSLSELITTMRQSGIAFDAAGISAEGLNDEILEALTRQGDGRYYLLDSVEDADDGFAQQIAGALRPSAKNVKVQIEFNPKRVGRYKLLGFEKHRLKKEDFRDDKVDAAEMAAAEAGVAVYQFQAKPDGEGDVGSVSVRFRDLSSGQMIENRWPIPYEAAAPRSDQAAPPLRLAAAAALLAAKLRGEPLGETVDLKALSDLVAGLPEQVRNADRVQQLQWMIRQARQLSGK